MEITPTADPVSTPAAGVPQHLQALARANRVRLARASLKREIAKGKTPVVSVIVDLPWQAESMSLSELLCSQPRWGQTRTRKLLNSVGLSENKRLDTLTRRQRTLLVSRLRPN